jgi:hypothetical protein
MMLLFQRFSWLKKIIEISGFYAVFGNKLSLNVNRKTRSTYHITMANSPNYYYYYYFVISVCSCIGRIKSDQCAFMMKTEAIFDHAIHLVSSFHYDFTSHPPSGKKSCCRIHLARLLRSRTKLSVCIIILKRYLFTLYACEHKPEWNGNGPR